MKKKSKSKTFLMTGGLGNQLFIYAAGHFYSLQNNENVIFDISSRLNGLLRRLNGLPPHGSDIRTLNSDILLRNQPIRWLVKSGLSRFLKWDSLSTYTSCGIGYDPALERHIAKNQVFGYFQSYRYLENPRIRDLMDSLHLASESAWFNKCAYEMQEVPTISIHIRRGDYLSLRDSFGVLSHKYYERAITFALENTLTDCARVLVFSDDIIAAKELLRNLEISIPIQFAEPQDNNPEESLMLMSRSAVLIMANSSFSWWAAQLGNRSKFVVCPSKWFRNMLEPDDLIPPNWHREESNWEIEATE